MCNLLHGECDDGECVCDEEHSGPWCGEYLDTSKILLERIFSTNWSLAKIFNFCLLADEGVLAESTVEENAAARHDVSALVFCVISSVTICV